MDAASNVPSIPTVRLSVSVSFPICIYIRGWSWRTKRKNTKAAQSVGLLQHLSILPSRRAGGWGVDSANVTFSPFLTEIDRRCDPVMVSYAADMLTTFCFIFALLSASKRHFRRPVSSVAMLSIVCCRFPGCRSESLRSKMTPKGTRSGSAIPQKFPPPKKKPFLS